MEGAPDGATGLRLVAREQFPCRAVPLPDWLGRQSKKEERLP
jgi:hypothetical protein